MAKVKIEKGSVFERYESKYLLSVYQHQGLRSCLQSRMEQDQYGLHTICTIYYDTADYAVIRRCLEKPNFKEKLRLRSYGIPVPGSTVYLELKKKMAGVTYKRRVPLPLAQAKGYLAGGLMPDGQMQILGEIDWYLHRQPLQPKVLICYDRIALFGLEDPDFRVTFDANIRWRDDDLLLEHGDYGSLLLPPKTFLMEVKTMNALPIWFAALLAQWKIYPLSFSKYGNIYQEYLTHAVHSEGEEEIRYAV